MLFLERLFVKVFESGIKIESRRLEHMVSILAALALDMFIAWRNLYICRVSRTHEDSSCDLSYDKGEWQSVWQFVEKSQPTK